MRSIVGHHRLTGGTVAFEGKALDRSAAHDRARSGIAFVPQGREVFPLLTVRETWDPASSRCSGPSATCRRRRSSCFRRCGGCWRAAVATVPAASGGNSSVARCRELADKVNIMDRGKIVHTGPAADLDKAEVRKFLTA